MTQILRNCVNEFRLKLNLFTHFCFMNTSSSYRARLLPSFKHDEFWLQFPRQNCHQKRESSDSYEPCRCVQTFITTTLGLFEWNRMPWDLDFCFAVQNDLEVVSPPEALHKLPLHLIFTRLREHELVIKAEKNVCMF
jgi:hypothetical protein